MCACVYVRMSWESIRVWRSGQPWTLVLAFNLVWDRVSVVLWGVYQCLTCELHPVSSYLTGERLWLQACTAVPCFRWVLGIRPQVLMFAGQGLYALSHLIIKGLIETVWKGSSSTPPLCLCPCHIPPERGRVLAVELRATFPQLNTSPNNLPEKKDVALISVWSLHGSRTFVSIVQFIIPVDNHRNPGGNQK